MSDSFFSGFYHTNDLIRPSSRVATAERKYSLLTDPQAKSSSARHVECAFCRTTVELDGVAQYDLTKWHEHKAKCSS